MPIGKGQMQSKRVSSVTNNPMNNYQGIQLLKLFQGTIVEGTINTDKMTASVRTLAGVFDDVMIPILGYSPGTKADPAAGSGLFWTPSANDNCIIGITNTDTVVMLNFYTTFGASDLNDKCRDTVPPHTFKFRTRSGDEIDISIAETESEADGERVVTRTEAPKISIKSTKNVELNVANTTNSYIISIEGDTTKAITTSVNKLTRKTSGIIDTTTNLSKVTMDSTGSVAVTTTDAADTGTITLETKKTGAEILVKSNTGTLSPVVTVDTIVKAVMGSALAVSITGGAAAAAASGVAVTAPADLLSATAAANLKSYPNVKAS